jgi:chromosome segregation protein
LGDREEVAAWVEAVRETRAALDALGDVNLGAADAYEELAARHDDLEAQRADLDRSVADLRSAIARLNRECRESFREAFDAIDGGLREVYPRLLGGGAARLVLDDTDDVLDAGVALWVQPPGKRLQHLGLLSGGEKAMAAIALLIAMFRFRPSSFCVLDEVDAPLDEANGSRFTAILREMARQTQVLVVTHHRQTMEVADTLYGVSMAPPGVSRVVSVRLAGAALDTAGG